MIALTFVTTAMWLLMVVVALVMVTTVAVWASWRRLEERKQRERLRQTANGGGADMPSWAKLRENRRKKDHHGAT